MPRNGAGVFAWPANTEAVAGEVVESADYNSTRSEILAEFNSARPVTAGGTGATSAAGARTNLGLAIGEGGVQAYDAGLASIAGLANLVGQFLYTTATNVFANAPITAFGRSLIAAANAGAANSLLGTAPAGAVMAFGMSTVPANWLECNGAAVNRTTYATLFAAIGTTWGAGDGSTTFNLPDLRGEFIRGWDHGKGTDTGRALASSQADELESHSHLNGVADDSAVTFVYGGSTTAIPGSATQAYSTSATALTHQGITSTTGGTETRPRNIALMYCIKT